MAVAEPPCTHVCGVTVVETVIEAGGATVTVAVFAHPFASVTITVQLPAVSPVVELVVAPLHH